MLEVLTQILHVIIEYGVLFFEYFGVGVLLFSGIKGIITFVSGRPVHLQLSKGLALGLEFLLIGEILHTVIVQTVDDMIFIGCLIVIRMFLALIINHEIESKQEQKLHKRKFEKELEHLEHEVEQEKAAHNH